MMKRFTETLKWRDPWFLPLSVKEKLIWLYLCDNCDIAGFWPICIKLLEYETGANEEDWRLFVKGAGEGRVRVIGEKAWLVKFVQFQFPRGLHPKNPARVAVERLLMFFPKEDLLRDLAAPNSMLISNLIEGATQQLRRSYVGPQEKEQEQEPLKEEGVQGGKPLKGLNGEIAKVFEAWNGLNGVSKCLVVTDKRRRTLGIRLGEAFFKEHWAAAMAKVGRSKFCQGESERGWRASFDWFITADAVTKIMEGKYDNKQSSGATKVW